MDFPLRLIEQPGMYRCTLCERVSEGRKMLRIDGEAVHPGCTARWIKRRMAECR